MSILASDRIAPLSYQLGIVVNSDHMHVPSCLPANWRQLTTHLFGVILIAIIKLISYQLCPVIDTRLGGKWYGCIKQEIIVGHPWEKYCQLKWSIQLFPAQLLVITVRNSDIHFPDPINRPPIVDCHSCLWATNYHQLIVRNNNHSVIVPPILCLEWERWLRGKNRPRQVNLPPENTQYRYPVIVAPPDISVRSFRRLLCKTWSTPRNSTVNWGGQRSWTKWVNSGQSMRQSDGGATAKGECLSCPGGCCSIQCCRWITKVDKKLSKPSFNFNPI